MTAMDVRIFTENEVREALGAGMTEARSVVIGMAALMETMGGNRKQAESFLSKPAEVYAAEIMRKLKLKEVDDGEPSER